MKRRLINLVGLLLGLGMGPVVMAQRTDTIYKEMAIGVNSAPYTTAFIPSIGQSQHIAYITARNAPGQTCVNPALTAKFIATYNNTGIVKYFPLSGGTLLINATFGFGANNFQGQLFVSGLAPYIKISIDTFDFTNCVVDIYYGGSLYPVFVSKLENSKFEAGLQTLAIQNTGSVALTPLIPALPNYSIELYGLNCFAQAATTIQTPVTTAYLPANGDFVLPPTGVPYLALGVGVGFGYAITTAGATVTTCNAQYRYTPN